MNTPLLADPVVRPAAICSGKSGHLCGAMMNPIRIYEGKGARPEMRGAICQSVCSSSHLSIWKLEAHHLFSVFFLLLDNISYSSIQLWWCSTAFTPPQVPRTSIWISCWSPFSRNTCESSSLSAIPSGSPACCIPAYCNSGKQDILFK